jgi:polysaccharide export outer membrane protein
MNVGILNMKANTLLLFLLACCLAPAASAQQQDSAQPVTTASQTPTGAPVSSTSGLLSSAMDQMGVRKYQLGPGDTLDLRVFGEPQFSDRVVVNDEGNVEVPFLDPIPALCRTDLDVKKDIVSALGKFLKNPQVSLRVVEMKSRPPAVIFGAVRNPTPFQLNRRVRLLELISRTGGATEQAGGDVHIYHTEPVLCPGPEDQLEQLAEQRPAENALQLPFNIYKISDLKLGKQEANPFIRPGDIVIVQEASPIFVTGAVVQPSNLYLRNQMSLMRAIAQVGGPRKGAKTDKVQIYRTKGNSLEPEIITVNFDDIKKKKRPDIALEPYDIVNVSDGSPFSLKNLPETLLGFATTGAQQVVSYGSVKIIN